jgi:ribosomal protein S18 acetylase RimI-like enzyme
MAPRVTIRPAEARDLDRLGALAGALVREHHAADPRRFFLVDGVEAGYARWLGRELARPGAVVLAAERDGAVVGYVYASLEERDWNALLDEHGAIHDVYVAEEARRSGVARALVEAVIAALTALGAQRVVLSTRVGNEAAQALFRACGFRPTMLEMTRG